MKVKFNFLKIFLYMMFACVTFSHAQSSSDSYTFKGITKTDGLSDLLVNVIHEDSRGYIWLGTGKGLDRFDGVRIKHYPFEHNLVEQRIRINTICETINSQIWVGNAHGLWKLDKLSGLLKPAFKEVISHTVNSLYCDDGYLYIGTSEGLYITDSETINQIHISDDTFSKFNDIRGVTKDILGRVWLVAPSGLLRYDPVTKAIKEYDYSELSGKEANFRNIICLNDVLYIGTFDDGIVCFDIENERFLRFLNLGSSIISSLSTDGIDMIYVATDGNGVFFISQSENRVVKSIRHHPDVSGGLRSNSIYSLLVDSLQRVWIGFYQDGLDYTFYQTGLFQTYKFPPHFDSANLTVRSFVVNDNHKLIGTRDGLYFIDEKREIVKKFDRSELQSDLILSLLLHDNKYYIGTYDAGLYVLDPVTLSVDRIDNDTEYLNSGHVFCFKADKDNNLWIGTSKGVVKINASGRIQLFTHINSPLPEGNVYEVFFDSSDKGWICTDKGMALIDPVSGDIRTNLFPEGFYNNEKIRTVYEDYNHMLYFFSEKGGLYRSDINMKTFSEIDFPAAEHVNVFMSIVEDSDNCLWFASDGGLIRLCNEDYKIFNYLDGIPSPVFTNNAVYKDESDVLWFGNAKGLLHVNPDELKSDESYSSVYLSDILINGKSIAPIDLEHIIQGERIELSPGNNTLSLQFSTLSFSDPQYIPYEYKISGTDKGWLVSNIENAVSLYNITPGKHRVTVRLPDDESSEVSFDILMKRSYSFIHMALLLLVLLSIIGVLYFKLIRKKVIDKEGIISEPPVDADSTKEDEKYKLSRLDSEQCKLLTQKLNAYMESQKPYINPTLRINDLAEAVETSSHNLSYLFSQHLDISYYDYVNGYRIAEFKRIVKQEDALKYTLDTLADMSGFSSRTSFFRSFKKYTGLTPNEYIKSLNKE